MKTITYKGYTISYGSGYYSTQFGSYRTLLKAKQAISCVCETETKIQKK